MPRQQPEAALQRAVMRFLALALPEDAIATTFPAGGGGRVRGAQLKAAGLVRGWPDVQILLPGPSPTCARPPGACPGRFIGLELKSKTGRCSPEQIACHARIIAAGGQVLVVRDIARLEIQLRALGVPLRATCGAKEAA